MGPQAPCTTLSVSTKITADPAQAYLAGIAEANAAANAASTIAMNAGPLYYDMESYTHSQQSESAVMTFLSTWTSELHQLGYRSGVYSSSSSGITGDATPCANGRPARLPSST